MSAVLSKLIIENENPFKLSLCAGQNSVRNTVSWVYMLEDENIISYFHGSELAVTTGIKQTSDSDWLLSLVKKLSQCGAAGLIVNVGMFIHTIPQTVLDYCNDQEFPLLTMPWEIRITDMTQSFCKRIIQEQHEMLIHDQAMADAIFLRGNVEAYTEVLQRYYDLSGRFLVILVDVLSEDEEMKRASEMEDIILNGIRRYKTRKGLKSVHFGFIAHENEELIVINNGSMDMLPDIRNIIMDVYGEAARAGALSMGVGVEVQGISEIYKSYHRARTAMRMAVYCREPYILFEDMGFYKIIFSVKDDELLRTYAGEVLGPIDGPSEKSCHYRELLKAYIQNDRSLEKTAADLYMHRNTVNYQIQKLKALLGSPLKTAEDLFPYQVALLIRDIFKSGPRQGKE